MQLTEISREDALMAAQVAQILSIADKVLDGLKLSGLPLPAGLDRRPEALRWFQALCLQMARSLEQPAAVDQTMRVKAMGSLTPGAPVGATGKQRKVKGNK